MLAFFGPGPAELLIIVLIFVFILVFTLLPFWLICTKAGFPAWYSLAMLFPILNIILVFFLAFAEWPSLRQFQVPKQKHK